MNGRRLARIVLALAFGLVLLLPLPAQGAAPKVDTSLLTAAAANPTRLFPVIVEMETAHPPFPPQPGAQLAQQALALLSLYGHPVGGLPIIDSAAGWANAAGINALALTPGVAYVHEDAVVRPSAAPDRFSAPHLVAAYPRAIDADGAWKRGATGRGVTVAVLDSGILRDGDLTTPSNRVLASVDFVGDRGGMDDPGGHGSHVAGSIAGNGARSNGAYVGIAPEANLVDVRVIDRRGNGRYSSVIRGIEWVVAHKDQYGVRAINLSLGAPPRTSYRLDPLAAAAEIAWRRGVVVLAAAGNHEPSANAVDSPGIDPYVVTVGATDDRGSAHTADDLLAPFSGWGTPPGSTSKPDVVAPGRRIVSLRAPGSYLNTLLPERVVTAPNGATYFRLTGTSMSTAVVSGVVGLLLERQGGLTPDQVKAILVGTTQRYGQAGRAVLADPAADGSGLVDALAAVDSRPLPAANRGLRPADAFARAVYPLIYGQPIPGVDWSSVGWDSVAWDSVGWDSVGWDSVGWDSVGWDSVGWDSVAWDSVGWDSVGWDSVGWDGSAGYD